MTIGRPQVSRLSTEDWEAKVGSQFRAVRLAAGLDQVGLAEQADVSIGALRNLERGAGSSLRTVIRVARTLNRESWLDAITPLPTVSPIEVLRTARTPRSRVYRARRKAQ
jgi:transcriptional regulator with XRE-family HTH domain